MTSTAFGSSVAASLDVPQTQNTAPVLEYLCMYTSDIRRKQQKRWQDGRLKFHSFNKRVMVYDERSNFVGDTHWRKDHEFDDGEELELERGGILVQVGECVGKRDQDLFELVDKRVKEREERHAARIGPSPSKPSGSLVRPQGTAASHLRPRSLNAVIGNPTGHYGRAVVPTISPFEDRQRLAYGRRDENEHDRPAKRRKQNESPPNKNGYARNLMGTKLSLGSAKPPSTATIRYEPLRTNRSVQTSPAVTIDLTNEDDKDGRDIERVRTNLKDKRGSTDTLSKIQKRKSQKSSPARSGYASNLTGAALTLSAPQSKLSKRANNSLNSATNQNARATGQCQVKSSLSDEQDSFVNIDSSYNVPVANIPKSKDVARKKVKPPRTGSTSSSRSSSPLRTDLFTSNAKEKSSHQRTPAHISPAVRPGTEQPVSALRIKSRPPRQMMMLMQRSGSRSSVSSEPSDRTPIPRTPQASRSAPNEVILSQATMRLNSFCQKQEHRLQERLNGKRSNIDTEQDEPLSSPTDSGINAQGIDILLSKRHVATDGGAILARAGKMPLPKFDQKSDLTSTSLENGQVSANKTPNQIINTLETPPNRDLASQAPTSMIKRSSSSACASKTSSFESAQSRVHEECELPYPPGPERLLESNIREVNQKVVESWNPTDDGWSTKFTSGHIPLEIKSTNTPVPREGPSASTGAKQTEKSVSIISSPRETKKPPIPKHVSEAIFAATDHFREIIKSSHISAFPENPSLSREAKAERGVSQHGVHGLEQVEKPCRQLIVKHSPKSSPLAQAINDEGKSSDVVRFTSANTINHIAELSKIQASRSRNARMDPPKPKLVNPATCGRSLHIIAKETVDALVPAINTMPPLPAPGISAQSGRVIGNDDAIASVPLGNVPSTGPWSREAFDLFGPWRPPVRDQGTGAING